MTLSGFVATDEQRAAIEHPATPLLVVAGAGTGKTSVMAERILDLVGRGAARPDQILALTFTNKATAALRHRVRERLGDDADVTVSTYHGFGAGLVADHHAELGLDRGTQLLDRAQAWLLLFTVFDEFRFEHRKTFRPDLVVTDALVLASRCADHLVDIDAVAADCDEILGSSAHDRILDAARGRRELCAVVATYERRKRERALIDYGDQIRLAAQLLRDRPEVAAGLGRRYPVVLLDEYQDTNYAQRVLLQAIYPPGSAVSAVGDDLQSIYAFRGAHLENILRFDEHFAPVARRPLSVNRRSGPDIVELANRIQTQVRRRLVDKVLEPLSGAPPASIECFLAGDDAEEAEEIAREIAELGPPWSRHAVLCRKRRQLIPVVVAALEARAVPAEAVGSTGLLDRPEIVDLFAWLEVLADADAAVALLRLLRGPRYRIGWRDLAALARHGRQHDVGLADAVTAAAAAAAADLSPEAVQRLTAFVAERAQLAAAAHELAIPDLVDAVASRTGLWTAAGDRGRENLLRFVDLAERFVPVDDDASLPAFVEYVQLLDQSDEDLPEADLGDHDAVAVMTVHQAKGLEFDHVWVPGLAGATGRWGIFPETRFGENPLTQTAALPWWLRADDEGLPSWRSVQKLEPVAAQVRERALDEEWRLFYVACTRARHRLVCSAAQWYPGPASPQGPSRFYDFVAAQPDLVRERFRHEPATVDPAVARRNRRAAAAVGGTVE